MAHSVPPTPHTYQMGAVLIQLEADYFTTRQARVQCMHLATCFSMQEHMREGSKMEINMQLVKEYTAVETQTGDAPRTVQHDSGRPHTGAPGPPPTRL